MSDDILCNCDYTVMMFEQIAETLKEQGITIDKLKKKIGGLRGVKTSGSGAAGDANGGQKKKRCIPRNLLMSKCMTKASNGGMGKSMGDCSALWKQMTDEQKAEFQCPI